MGSMEAAKERQNRYLSLDLNQAMRIRLAGFPRSISLRAAAGIPRCRPAATRGVSARRSGVVSKIVVLVLVLDLGADCDRFAAI